MLNTPKISKSSPLSLKDWFLVITDKNGNRFLTQPVHGCQVMGRVILDSGGVGQDIVTNLISRYEHGIVHTISGSRYQLSEISHAFNNRFPNVYSRLSKLFAHPWGVSHRSFKNYSPAKLSSKGKSPAYIIKPFLK